MAYKKLFEPGRIGGLTIRNRAVMSPMGTDLADIRGNATPRLIAYYTERAKGGIGLIINEYTGVDDVDSIPTQHNLRMAQDYNVQEAEELTRSVHAYGARGRGAPGDDPGGHQAGAGEVHRRRHPLQEGGL